MNSDTDHNPHNFFKGVVLTIIMGTMLWFAQQLSNWFALSNIPEGDRFVFLPEGKFLVLCFLRDVLVMGIFNVFILNAGRITSSWVCKLYEIVVFSLLLAFVYMNSRYYIAAVKTPDSLVFIKPFKTVQYKQVPSVSMDYGEVFYKLRVSRDIEMLPVLVRDEKAKAQAMRLFKFCNDTSREQDEARMEKTEELMKTIEHFLDK